MRGLIQTVAARLDARLQTDVAASLAVALSGGGDSVALLALAADWARANGRRLIALTVDHGLSPDSERWTAFAAGTAARAGADFRALHWTGDRPATGLPAAARAARHALLAQAARAAGARVLLMAHTADDIAESDWMRAHGSNLGRLAEWGPSPAWPQGRGIALFRPLLDVRRAALREYLIARALDWIEDPANADPRFARARARQALDGAAPASAPEPSPRPAPLDADAFGVIRGPRRLSARDLSLAVVCASGGSQPPRGPRLAALIDRLAAPGPVTAVLGGARVEASGDAITVLREAGEFRRRPPVLTDDVWDGRFEVAVPPGVRIAPAAGLMARLGDADRAHLAALPAPLRPTLPVLFRNPEAAPILARDEAGLRSLVGDRLALAQGGLSHEGMLARPSDGGTPYEGLSWQGQDKRRAPTGPDRENEKRNEPA